MIEDSIEYWKELYKQEKEELISEFLEGLYRIRICNIIIDKKIIDEVLKEIDKWEGKLK